MLKENLERILAVKQNIKSALEDKKVDMAGVTFSDYATKINEFPTVIDIIENGISGHHMPYIINASQITKGAFAYRFLPYWSDHEELNFSKCNNIEGYAFYNTNGAVGAVKNLRFPICSRIGGFAFCDCNFKKIYLPECQSIPGFAFSGATGLDTVVLSACSSISNYAFYYCFSFLSLYLLGSSVAMLDGSQAMQYTPIKDYTSYTSGVTGNIFVRASLLEAYKTKTNWTYFSNKFIGLTDEEIENLEV